MLALILALCTTALPEPSYLIIKVDANQSASYTIHYGELPIQPNAETTFYATRARIEIKYLDRSEIVTRVLDLTLKPGTLRTISIKIRSYPETQLARVN